MKGRATRTRARCRVLPFPGATAPPPAPAPDIRITSEEEALLWRPDATPDAPRFTHRGARRCPARKNRA